MPAAGCRACGGLSFLFGKDEFEGGGELVGARGGLGAAAYAFESVDDLLGRLPFDEGRDALGIAMATAGESH